jgi:Kef-type K+ transport system membrane component KefB
MMANKAIDWSSLWKKEDWWACWIGWFILFFGIAGWVPKTPKISRWTTSLAQAFPQGMGIVGEVLIFFIFTGILTMIGAWVMKRDVKRFIPGYFVLVIIAVIATVIANQKGIRYYGFEYVLWALFIGLFISNVFKTPEWLKPAIMTEFFIKIGLVCMGAEIMFSIVIKAGAVGLAQAVLVVIGVWFVTFWICRKFGLSERFSSIIATGNSICGVSASIAAGGAVQGDPKEVSYIVAWLMICAVLLIVIMPPWPSGPTFLQHGRSLDRRGH